MNKKYSGVISDQCYLKQVIYSEPATIAFWSDGTKTVTKCSLTDIYSPEAGLALCFLKKMMGASEVRTMIHDWVPETYVPVTRKVSLADVIKKRGR